MSGFGLPSNEALCPSGAESAQLDPPGLLIVDEPHPLADVVIEAERILAERSICTCGTARGGRLHCGWHFHRHHAIGDDVDRVIWLLGQLGGEQGIDTASDTWIETAEELARRMLLVARGDSRSDSAA